MKDVANAPEQQVIRQQPVSGMWARMPSCWLRRGSFRERRFRKRILPLIESVIARKGTCSILDVGGDPDYWPTCDLPSIVSICILNIEAKRQPDDRRFRVIQADARHVSALPDNSFDLVHSNSLIEHVGRWADIRAAAREIRRLAPAYYVQTPNYWFPVDPHSNLPFVHWLPHPVQRQIFTRKARGFYGKAETIDDAMAIIDGTNMLDHTQMAELFPDADIEVERFAYLGKSLMAVRAQA